MMPSRDLPRTTPDWEAAARRQAMMWVVVALLLAALLAVLAYQAWQGLLPPTGPRRPAMFAVRPLGVSIPSLRWGEGRWSMLQRSWWKAHSRAWMPG